MSGSGRISPTAHYTGYVWARNGLSHPALETVEGRVLYEAMRPVLRGPELLGSPKLETYLLARHTAIDEVLRRAIDEHQITQVVELACGMSPRGWRFAERYGDRLTYVEADLPEMAARKRRALEQIETLSEHHRVEEIDALRDNGPGSLAAVAEQLDPAGGLAILTEGLLGYLDDQTVSELWRRFAQTLSGFARGRYIADLPLRVTNSPQLWAFRLLLGAFVRGRVHLHFNDPREAVGAATAAGFASAELHSAARLVPETRGAGAGYALVLEAVSG
jgi:O-methyltransferase involved in polyketide biosynthesis